MKSTLLAAATTLFCASAALASPLEFTLEHFTKGQVTQDSYPDQYLLISVGYLSCPDVCPTTMMTKSLAMETLGEDVEKLTGLFLTIDPNRDTAENLQWYVEYFHERMDGLTGTDAQVAAAARNLKASYGYTLEGKPVYDPLPDYYDVFHSAYIYLYGPDHELRDVYSYAMDGELMAEQIRVYLNEDDAEAAAVN